MTASREQRFRELVSGRRRGAGAAVLRGVLRIAAAIYAVLTALRNKSYDWSILASDRLPKPSICVGNITTGGTGKTPVVRWLAEHLRESGLHPAILMRGYMRGYKSRGQAGSDEQRLLARLLDHAVPVVANPNRIEGAQQALKLDPHVDAFILDDGFQRRSVKRDFDLVLIDATNPLGYGHQLPRGLLRESPRQLRRASAILITRVDAIDHDQAMEIEASIRRYNAWSPIYRCRHVHQNVPSNGRFFMFCGIGNPEAFARQLNSSGRCVGSQFFDDHHVYTASDIAALDRAAADAGAEVILTTQKDWVKVEPLLTTAALRSTIQPVELGIEFEQSDGSKLLQQILSAVGKDR